MIDNRYNRFWNILFLIGNLAVKWHVAIAFIILMIVFLVALCGCHDPFLYAKMRSIEAVNGLPDRPVWENGTWCEESGVTPEQRAILIQMRRNAMEARRTADQYAPSKDSPYWAPYYDPELTNALNRPSATGKSPH